MGESITLRQCDLTSWTPGRSLYVAQEVYVGEHFSSAEDQPAFRRIAAQFSNLAAWVRYSKSLRHNLEVDFPSEEPKIAWNPTCKLETIQDGVKITLWSTMDPAFGLDQASVKAVRSIEFESPHPLSIDAWHRRYLYPFRHLITLGTGEATTLTSLSGTLDPPNPQSHPTFVTVLHYYVQSHPKKTQRWNLSPSDMFFHLGDVEADYSRFLAGWFSTYEKCRGICDEFFGLSYNPPTYVEQRFLGVVQAAESFHREIVKPYKIDKAVHEERVKRILSSALTPEDKAWLERALASAVEPALHERLKDLMIRTDDIVGPLVRDRAQFLRVAIRARHALTHRLTARLDDIPGPNALARLARTLSFLFRGCLLAEMGFASAQYRPLFDRNRDYHWATKDRDNTPEK